jgi:hypothetical protein
MVYQAIANYVLINTKALSEGIKDLMIVVEIVTNQNCWYQNTV